MRVKTGRSERASDHGRFFEKCAAMRSSIHPAASRKGLPACGEGRDPFPEVFGASRPRMLILDLPCRNDSPKHVSGINRIETCIRPMPTSFQARAPLAIGREGASCASEENFGNASSHVDSDVCPRGAARDRHAVRKASGGGPKVREGVPIRLALEANRAPVGRAVLRYPRMGPP